MVRGESFFLRDFFPGIVSTSRQAPCSQPVGELSDLLGLSRVQLALIYTPKAHGTWRENSSCARLPQRELLKEDSERRPGARGGAERGFSEG